MNCNQPKIIRVPRGNDFTLLVYLSQNVAGENGMETADIADTATTVIVVKQNGTRIHIPKTTAGMDAHALQWGVATTDDGLAIAITIPCNEQTVGIYGLEIKGTKEDDSHWRYKAKPGEAFEIVDATSDQHLPDNQVRIYAIGAVIGIGSQSQDMTGYATQQWVRDQGYLTEHQSFAGYATQKWVRDQRYLTEHQSLMGYATEQWVQQQGYLTQHQNISHLEGKILLEEKSTASFNAETGRYYRCTYNGVIAVTLPSMSAGEQYLKGLIVFATASADDSITFTSNDGKSIIKAEGYKIEAGCTYEINCVFNGAQWVVTAVKFES